LYDEGGFDKDEMRSKEGTELRKLKAPKKNNLRLSAGEAVICLN